jgi:hypothetical protein
VQTALTKGTALSPQPGGFADENFLKGIHPMVDEA